LSATESSGACVNLDAGVSPAGDAETATGSSPTPAARWTADARYWLLAVVSLALACSVMFGRYLFWDTFYDLYAGRYIVRHGIPRTNVLTVASAGARWVDQQWLATCCTTALGPPAGTGWSLPCRP